MLAVQVALDRAGFSPGEIDGQGGAKTRLAITAFQTANNLSASGTPDQATLAALHVASEPVTSYTITEQDAAGPFLGSMPKDLMEASKLPALGYTSALEEVAEKFHSSQAFLRRLNPGASWNAGDAIKVPDVEPFEVPSKAAPVKPAGRSAGAKPPAGATGTAGTTNNAIEVVVNGATKSLIARDSTGHILMHAPITTGWSQGGARRIRRANNQEVGTNAEFFIAGPGAARQGAPPPPARAFLRTPSRSIHRSARAARPARGDDPARSVPRRARAARS